MFGQNEFGKKATTVALAMMLSASVMAGCSSSQAGVSGSSSSSEATSSVAEVDKSAFVGTWDLVDIAWHTGESMGREEIEGLRQQGLDSFLLLNEDGTAVESVLRSNYYGTWDASSPTEGTIDIYRDAPMSIEDGKLVYHRITGDTYTLEKGDPKEALSEADYNAALSAFTGTWTAVSMTKDGITLDASGQGYEIELRRNGDGTVLYGGDSIEMQWGVLSATTGFIDYPVGGEQLSVDGDILTMARDDYSIAFQRA